MNAISDVTTSHRGTVHQALLDGRGAEGSEATHRERSAASDAWRSARMGAVSSMVRGVRALGGGSSAAPIRLTGGTRGACFTNELASGSGSTTGTGPVG